MVVGGKLSSARLLTRNQKNRISVLIITMLFAHSVDGSCCEIGKAQFFQHGYELLRIETMMGDASGIIVECPVFLFQVSQRQESSWFQRLLESASEVFGSLPRDAAPCWRRPGQRLRQAASSDPER